jgi:hypothetical protein
MRDKARRLDVAAFRAVTQRQAEQPATASLIRELRDSARF